MKCATLMRWLVSTFIIAGICMQIPRVAEGCSGGGPDSGPRTLETSLPGAASAIDATVGSYNVRPDVVGSFAIAGSDTLQPIMVKLATAFKSVQPGVKVAVQGGGSNVAIAGFVSDQATIRRGDAQAKGHLVSSHVPVLASSRQLTQSERAAFRSRHGYDPTEIPIALDAVGVYVNGGNPIQGLTMQQVDAIFGKDRKRGYPQALTKWGDLGLEQSWGLHDINLYGRDQGSGTRTFFIDEVLLGGTMHPDVQELSGSATEILEISRDPFGIGYAGIGFQASAVRVVPLSKDSGLPFVTPSATTVRDGSYPLVRELYVYVNKPSDREFAPDVRAFLMFVNSRQGQEIIARSGVYPLSAAQIATNVGILNESLVSAREGQSK